ncbi:MAG: biopolymer transporter ExbD [Gammaproteobacteria bacterium]|nr:biopolymer transporter ExbD [Gammaproteobacteria bacterium]
MNLQSRSKEEPEVNLTSLIDVVLLLLVFFMVSTSFVRETEISLRLPQAQTQTEPVIEVENLEIIVTETGGYLVNGRALVNSERSTLRTAIEQTIGDSRDLPVFVRADAMATHQAVVTAMDVAGQLGFVQISIATVTPPED